MALDEVDARIIAILRERGDEPNTAIAKSIGLSEAAVRKRIANLVQSGTIKRFTIELGSNAAISALTLVVVDSHAPVDKVAEKIARMPGVSALYEITGNYDIAVILEGPDSDSINARVDEIRGLKHVSGTETKMVLRKWR
ncbi:HTH-type transcriptional regulator LysM [Candidatus Burarchaeum australiense]|nr:HTH-type transcriptional regulator LysM [Candidatus Burarchaeum australiense]